MSTVTTKPQYSPEDLLAMPDVVQYELVDGHLVERNMGALSSWVGGDLNRLLSNFAQEHGLGWLWPADNSYQCFPDQPNKVRKPDVSFIRRGRLPGEQLPEGHVRIPPDLAVEVVSPNDLYSDVDEKVQEYLEAGVPLVWVVSPETRSVLAYRADGSSSRLREQEELRGEDVLPGFRCQVSEIFLPPIGAGPAV
jgi:Uma2 family endonuclease